MKPGKSALNPHAGAYVPLSKEEGCFAKPAAAAATLDVQYQPCGAYGYDGVQGMGIFLGSQMYTPKTTSSSHNQQMRDEDLDLELDTEEKFAALLDNLSHESIIDAYLANNGDLDATIDMNQLL
ncbi:Polyadenylate-binding protein-interacting protein 6 [Raphanus sativus]|nr:Polyadenylate-binding protein-interacting protein 6 [Raphanus sativus]